MKCYLLSIGKILKFLEIIIFGKVCVLNEENYEEIEKGVVNK